jgi:hypothetical protein
MPFDVAGEAVVKFFRRKCFRVVSHVFGSRAPDPLRYTVLFAADAPFSRSVIAPIAENCRVHRLP